MGTITNMMKYLSVSVSDLNFTQSLIQGLGNTLSVDTAILKKYKNEIADETSFNKLSLEEKVLLSAVMYLREEESIKLLATDDREIRKSLSKMEDPKKHALEIFEKLKDLY